MALHRVRPRIRFQGHAKKTQQDAQHQMQDNIVRNAAGATQKITLVGSAMDNAPLYVKKRVPSTHELGDALRSNLSSSLATSKAHHNANTAKPPHAGQRIEQTSEGEEDNNPPEYLSKIASLRKSIVERPSTTPIYATGQNQGREDDDPSASLLATTAIYQIGHPSEEASTFTDTIRCAGREQKSFIDPNMEVEKVDLTDLRTAVDQDGDDDPPASLLALVELSVASPVDPELVSRPPAIDHADAHRCAVENNCDLQSSIVRSPKRSVKHIEYMYIEPTSQSVRTHTQSHTDQPSFMQCLVTLFAGRRRCRVPRNEALGAQPSAREHSGATASSANLGTTRHTSRQQTSTQPGPCQPPAPLQKGTGHLSGTTSAKADRPNDLRRPNPPSLPEFSYRPHERDLYLRYLKPSRHPYVGRYYVAPDVFQPAEVIVGFPSATPPASPTSPVCRKDSKAQRPERDGSVWGRWYAKYPTAEHLPFAKVRSNKPLEGISEEITDLQVWDRHAARHAEYRGSSTTATAYDEMGQARDTESMQHERADRLRHHPGHCFGALTGDVYPYQGGMIF